MCVDCSTSFAPHMHLSVAAKRTGRAGGAVLDAFAHDRAQHLHRRRRARQAEAAEDIGVGLDEILRGEGRARRVTEGCVIDKFGYWMGFEGRRVGGRGCGVCRVEGVGLRLMMGGYIHMHMQNMRMCMCMCTCRQ